MNSVTGGRVLSIIHVVLNNDSDGLSSRSITNYLDEYEAFDDYFVSRMLLKVTNQPKLPMLARV